MTEQGAYHEAHINQTDEQKERIKRALLTPADTWFNDILKEDFEVTDQWLVAMNDKLLIAGINLDGHDFTKHAQEVKTKRQEVFAELAKNSKNEALAKAFNSFAEINSQPLVIFKNARYLSLAGFNIADLFTRAYYLFYFKTPVLTERVNMNIELYGKGPALRLMSQNPQAFLGNPPPHNTLKMSALTKVNEAFRFTDDTIGAVDKAPGLMTNALAKNIAIARIAFEFCEPESNITVTQINTALAQPLDSHMLTLIENRNYNLNRAQYYRKKVPKEERRGRVLGQLSSGICRMIGGNVLRSYFKAEPLSEAEKEQYIDLAESCSGRFREYNQPFTNRSMLLTEADTKVLSQLASKPSQEMTPQWLTYMNHLLRRGSRDARPQGIMKEHNPVIRARLAFFRQLGWDAPDHPMGLKLKSNLKRVRPDTLVAMWRLAIRYGHEPIEFISHCSAIVFEVSMDRMQVINKVLSTYAERSDTPLEIDIMRKVMRGSTLAHVAVLAAGCTDPVAGITYVQERSLAGVKTDLRALLGSEDIPDEALFERGLRLLR